MSTRQSVLQLRAKMLLQGLSVRAWARAHNFNEETVHAVIRLHWGRNSKIVGEKTRQIIEALQKDFGANGA